MQDITPIRRTDRGSLRTTRVPARSGQTIGLTSRTARPTGYITRTKTVTDIIMPNKEVVITKTVTTSVAAEPKPVTKPIESLNARAKSEALQRALLSAQRELRSERRKRLDMKRVSVVFAIAAFVLMTGYVSINTIVSSSRAKSAPADTSLVD